MVGMKVKEASEGEKWMNVFNVSVGATETLVSAGGKSDYCGVA